MLVHAGGAEELFSIVCKHCVLPHACGSHCHCWFLKGQRTISKPRGALLGRALACEWLSLSRTRPPVTCCPHTGCARAAPTPRSGPVWSVRGRRLTERPAQ